jgi:uncharacterized RDD family membrane protein YckC
MATPTPTKPDRLTGLPPGVSVGPLGRRVVAQLVDAVPLVVLVVILVVGGTALRVVAGVLLLTWCVLLWWRVATRAAGPGMRLVKLQLVGFSDGRPIGWSRVFVRAVILTLLTATGVGLLVMLVLLLRHPRYQGWHDIAADSVVIAERALAPRAGSRPSENARAVTPSPPVQPSSPSAAAPDVPRPLTPPSGPAGPDALPLPVPAAALPLAPSGVEGGAAVLAPAAPGATEPPAVAEGPVGPEGPGVSETPTQTTASPAATGVEPPVEGPAAHWVAELDDGREVAVQGLVLLGRNPQPRPGEEGAELIKLADQSRTVSKSHLALGVDERGMFVTDRGSTNGSVVTSVNGTRTRCAPGEVVPVSAGSVVSMGDHWFRVRRS